MKSLVNFEDVLSLSWLASLARIKVANKAKDIKKNDSTFELHDQFATAVQSSYLANMFDNYTGKNPSLLSSVKSFEDVMSFMHGMLSSYGIQLQLKLSLVKSLEG